MSQVAQFYDEFSQYQRRVGINHRHLSIIHSLEKAGLKRSDYVLEVGCGVGTVSELILRFLSNKGKLHAVDISPDSIECAALRCKKYTNASFEVLDVTSNKLEKTFNVIVLPDVIEHIPTTQHHSFFQNLFESLDDNGFVFIHIPHPNYLEWLIQSRNQELQIIDQAIYSNELGNIVYPIGFYIHFLKSYSVYRVDPDYQIIILKKKNSSRSYDLRRVPLQLNWLKWLKMKLRYFSRGLR